MRSLQLVLVALFVVWAGAAQRKPNIIFILADDLGYADLSCYGQQNWQTPRLDEMAAEGLRFTQAYAGCTVCAPSRATLLTGQHTGHVYQRGNGQIQFRRDPLDITIATRLKKLGYRTAMIGKSGLGCRTDDAKLPNDKGFDYYYGFLDHANAHRNYPKQLYRNGDVIELPGNQGKQGDTYANALFVDDALRWIKENQAKPFFLHLSITPPHADLTVPERYMAPFRGKFTEQPVTKGGYFHQQEPLAAYAGMVAFVDESVGRVLDLLETLDIDEKTVVFFASDNGPHLEGGAHPDNFDSNGPLRGGKRDLTEGGIRTPQIVWWPGTVKAGTETDVITAFWDFPATALDLAGAPVPKDFDGLSIVPTMLGKPAQQKQHAYLYWEFYERGGKQAVRAGQWKGIRLHVKQDRHGPLEVYDLSSDLGETNNVAEKYPEVRARLSHLMDEAHTPSEQFKF